MAPFPEKLKLAVKQRAHFHCCLCHALGVEIHHIIPQGEGGLDDEENAAPLCPSCHETYGQNPEKRKFIREARDFWYEVCSRRYVSDNDQIDRIAGLVANTATKADVNEAIDRLLQRDDVSRQIADESTDSQFIERADSEIHAAVEELFDKVWYNRHQNRRIRVEEQGHEVDPDIWKEALAAAERVRAKYGEDELGPWDDFEWGMLNGKLSALRWVTGDEWDFLDT